MNDSTHACTANLPRFLILSTHVHKSRVIAIQAIHWSENHAIENDKVLFIKPGFSQMRAHLEILKALATHLTTAAERQENFLISLMIDRLMMFQLFLFFKCELYIIKPILLSCPLVDNTIKAMYSRLAPPTEKHCFTIIKVFRF